MKTLDEVIKVQERCEKYPNCHFCFLHAGDICGWIRDALDYLKEYREMLSNVENDPLDWEELCLMKGKPVWIKWISGTWAGQSKWGIVSSVDDNILYFIAMDVAQKYVGHIWKRDYSTECLAYRKERK